MSQTGGAPTSSAERQLFIFLQAGDVIEAGDECPSDNCDAWEPVSRWTIGRPASPLFKTIRRRVFPTAPEAGPFGAVMAEVRRTTTIFPTWPTDPLHALAVLGEEFGELTKATLQLTYEPHKSTIENFRQEAHQTAAMALRFLASIDSYQFTCGPQHQQTNDDVARSKIGALQSQTRSADATEAVAAAGSAAPLSIEDRS